ncbi:MAG: ATP-binding cassette domain-containing protein, partial [Campylobacteraceae bacterium]|nr:ATP-binding cassette domain-containing protein [Campylobacteraceae bacterium]
MSVVVELKNIEKRFGDVIALDDINITVNSGEWVSIMGPSGSGKTTLLNILSLMDTPTDGEYLLEGVDASKLSEAQQLVFRREKIGLVFQQFHLIPYLTALENVMLAQYYHSTTDEEDA